jgi:lipopolysaccharide/colanic/teichoic acid biosynthesis glycosyltransferase
MHTLENNKNTCHPDATAAPEASAPGWKRVFDAVLIFLALPVLLPLMIFIAILVRVVSAGPVLFRQERVGLKGKHFKCFKFRTMVVGNHVAAHKGYTTQLIGKNVPMTKMDERCDPRIIPFGAHLRAAGLDELPQIFNILMGQMSLVGPRPCVPYEAEKYEKWQWERFDVLPGLTGLWQVSGKNNTTFDEMMHLDIRYARECSPWMDIRIILRTIPALVVQVRETRRRRRAHREAQTAATQEQSPVTTANGEVNGRTSPPGGRLANNTVAKAALEPMIRTDRTQ